MIKSDIKILKERALAGDLSALEELRKMGLLSGKKSGYVIAPASYSQRRLWFIDQMDKSPAYNLPALIKFSGELDIDALERSFKELIKRHESLRTVFTENEGVPYQKIYTTSDFRLKKEDVRGREDKSSIIDELIREESRRCFDLTGGPLLVCSLLRTEESEYILIFNMHHIISDGWSIGVMIAELTSFYNAFSSGKEAEISPLPVQYRDYAKRQEVF
ncbi:MAG: condensation domain-containing protein [Bacteroidales bacterium]|nr:condensation domain-containing protein [Bacteroidales bacterium]